MGPPAVGKLTIAEAVAERTGFKLFHNHLTWNLVTSVFEMRSEAYFRLLPAMRTLMFAEAARSDISLIFTFVYATSRAEVAESYFEAVEQNGGEVCLVQLKADYAVLEQRVGEASRKAHGKLDDAAGLKRYFDSSLEMGIDQPVLNRESLVVDTGKMGVGDSAELIIDHYNL